METISYNLVFDISSHLIFYSLKTVVGTIRRVIIAYMVFA